MRFALLALPALALFAGCAGYAIDYTKPRTSLIAPELARYGFDGGQAQCVADRLAASLSVWQLRQLQMRAASVTTGYTDPARLTPADLIYVSRHVEDPAIAPQLSRAAEGCGLGAVPTTLAVNPPAALPPAPEPVATPTQPLQPAPARRRAQTWISLGAAPTGQTIAVDASSLAEQGGYRTGWFRLPKPGESSRSANSYLLRVDCTARTINSMALRKHGPDGTITEERSYGTEGEGAVAAEAGTVLEIAYLSLCSQ